MNIFLDNMRLTMKSSVYLFLFALLISCYSKGDDVIENKEVDIDAKTGKAFEDLPDVVLKNFKAKYPGANFVKWEKDEDIFDVVFILDGQEYEAEFDKTGKWIETEEEIKIGDLPEAIQKVLHTNYSGYKIVEAEYVETADYGVIYDVVIEKGDEIIEIYFYPDGMILKEETEYEDDENAERIKGCTNETALDFGNYPVISRVFFRSAAGATLHHSK